MGGKEGKDGRKGHPNRYHFLLEDLLKSKRVNFAKEFARALKSDLEEPKNLRYLNVLIRMLPYICVVTAEADAAKIGEIIKLIRTKQSADPIIKSEELKNLNNILALEKEKLIAVSNGKN